jgi:hypothetical protein
VERETIMRADMCAGELQPMHKFILLLGAVAGIMAIRLETGLEIVRTRPADRRGWVVVGGRRHVCNSKLSLCGTEEAGGRCMSVASRIH